MNTELQKCMNGELYDCGGVPAKVIKKIEV